MMPAIARVEPYMFRLIWRKPSRPCARVAQASQRKLARVKERGTHVAADELKLDPRRRRAK